MNHRELSDILMDDIRNYFEINTHLSQQDKLELHWMTLLNMSAFLIQQICKTGFSDKKTLINEFAKGIEEAIKRQEH